MYAPFREFCERLLRIPADPEPPPGDEQSTQRFRAADNFYKYLVLLWAIGTVVLLGFLSVMMIGPIAGAFALTRKGNGWGYVLFLVPGLVLGVASLICLFRLAIVKLDFEKRWYLVTDRSLRVREGVLKVQEMTITFANIQNISISQGPLQRLLGISDLRLDTAGGGSGGPHQHHQNLHTAWFRGVDNAAAIRELIRERLNRFKDAGLGDHDDGVTRSLPDARGGMALGSKREMLAALREVEAEARALRIACSAPRE